MISKPVGNLKPETRLFATQFCQVINEKESTTSIGKISHPGKPGKCLRADAVGQEMTGETIPDTGFENWEFAVWNLFVT